METSGIPAPYVDHNVAVLGGELPGLVTDRFAVKCHGCISGLSVLLSAA